MNLIAMVEVFKTDVDDPEHAGELLRQIREHFPNYQSNFDLDDCDRILRIKNVSGRVDAARVIEIVTRSGYNVECLT